MPFVTSGRFEFDHRRVIIWVAVSKLPPIGHTRLSLDQAWSGRYSQGNKFRIFLKSRQNPEPARRISTCRNPTMN